MSMEFSTEAENFVQLLHELVLVPSVYFFPDLSLVHAAVLCVDGKATLLAGTGGTGKTSALLAIRNNKDVSFVSDDIAIIGDDGLVYPNLAWPKVYGYNLSRYITKEELLRNRGFIDKIQFNLKLKKNPKSVRRKVKPNLLYTSFENQAIPIERVIYLFRDSSVNLNLRKLDKEKSIELGIHIMKTEYGIFHNYIEWDQYCSSILESQPLLDTNIVFENWRNNLKKAFKDKDIKTLHIPSKIEHHEYLEYMNKLIENS